MATVTQKIRVRSKRYQRRFANRAEQKRRVPWPESPPPQDGSTAAVIVSFNTRELTRHTLHSLFSAVGPDLGSVVVVDNGSDDGSLEDLRAAAHSGALTLLENRGLSQHGPGLNAALSYLAAVPEALDISEVWLLDSDVVILREDVLKDARRAMRLSGAAVVGEKRSHSDLVLLCSILLDPRRAWRADTPVFLWDGLPSDELQEHLLQQRERIEQFPFADGGYLIHVGAGTLRMLRERGEEVGDWSATYSGLDDGEDRYLSLLTNFRRGAGALDATDFAECLRELRSPGGEQ